MLIFAIVRMHDILTSIEIVLVMVMVLIVVVMLTSYRKYKAIYVKENALRIINSVISEAIVTNEFKRDQAIVNRLHEPIFRDLLIDTLVEAELKFSGAAFQSIRAIFDGYNLQPSLMKTLTSGRILAKGKAIRELSALRVMEALPLIEPMVYHPSQHVYKEAQSAMVRLKGFQGLAYLSEWKLPLSDWLQLKLLSTFTKIPAAHVSMVDTWLSNDNPYVLLFTLRVIRKFQLLTYLDTVIEFLTHENIKLRLQAVRTLDMIEGRDTTSIVMNHFPQQEYLVQMEILRLLSRIKNPESVDFLILQLQHHPHPSVRVLAAEALVTLGKQDTLITLAAEDKASNANNAEEEYSSLQLIVKHALKEKIC